MNSVWKENSNISKFKELEHDISTDILIVGGGLAGILLAYELQNRGVDYVLLEADRICRGITGNTTAKITSQHGLIYSKITDEFDIESAKMYYEANEKAIRKYRRICKNIDCDFEEKDSYVYSMDGRAKLEKELDVLRKIGANASFTKDLQLPFRTDGAVKFENQAQFNPLKFVEKISENLNIYEGSKVRELIQNTAVTNKARVKAKKIVAATHFPFINKHGSYFMKMYQHRSYVIAFENAQYVDGMYVDEADKGMSFRNYKNLLLVGGGGHRTGKQGGNWQEIENFANRYYPKAHEKYRWATQDCMTLDGFAYIGNYSKRTPDFYVTTGFNKWGMTSSMVSASILADMLTGRKNPYEKLYSPSRTILRPQLAANSFEAVANIITFSEKRCPHLGCSLKWNSAEHSWDCPCHGSRFDENGKLLDNPSTADLKK